MAAIAKFGSDIPFLSVRGVSKTFSGVTVLRDAHLDIYPGEIHGLVGQNGSGKSTLIKILSGYHQPDPHSTLSFDGQVLNRQIDTATVGDLGLAFIHQDLALVPSMTVLENMRIGHFETTRLGRIPWRRERDLVSRQLAEVGLDVDPTVKVSSLPAVEWALVAIARGVANIRLATEQGRTNGLLVLDEPTAYLPADGVDRLFAVLHNLSQQGIGVLLVTHRLDEITRITDRVTVLRDGEVVGTFDTSSTDETRLIAAILGQKLSNLYPETVEAVTDTALEVSGLRGRRMRQLDLKVNRGEIIGITGLAGMGHEEIPYLITGAQPAEAGSLILCTEHGVQEHFDLRTLTPAEAIVRGLYLLPADRTGSSGTATLGVGDNLTLPFLQRFTSRKIIDREKELAMVTDAIDRFSIVPPDPDRVLGELSGGNQQKVLLAKWLMGESRYAILHEPTQGVDVGAKKDILGYIAQAAANGTTFVIVSVEYEDLARLCDRVLVVRQGRVVRDMKGAELSTANVATAVYESA